MTGNKKRILLIDRHPEWLEFARESLQHDYEVKTLANLEEITISDPGFLEGFDLTFIGLELATEHLDALKSIFKEWHFVVIFPVFKDDEVLRLLFRSGVYDCATQPYDREGLLSLVSEELARVQILNKSKNTARSHRPRQQAVQDLASILRLEEFNHG
jgi:DNA-binding NtrC family response regulator